jgi:hypothetical protein
VNLDSLPALRQELREELSNGLGQFRARLIDRARPWAVVVPGEQDIRCWRKKNSTAAQTLTENLLSALTPHRRHFL